MFKLFSTLAVVALLSFGFSGPAASLSASFSGGQANFVGATGCLAQVNSLASQAGGVAAMGVERKTFGKAAGAGAAAIGGATCLGPKKPSCNQINNNCECSGGCGAYHDQCTINQARSCDGESATVTCSSSTGESGTFDCTCTGSTWSCTLQDGA